jgi:hypothetical protein
VRNLAGASGPLVSVEGEAIRYNSPYTVRDAIGEFEETMLPGVAVGLLDSADCRFLVNHTDLPLARSTAGTLTLTDSSKAFRLAPPLTPANAQPRT